MLETISVVAFLLMVGTWATQPARARLSRVRSQAPMSSSRVAQETSAN